MRFELSERNDISQLSAQFKQDKVVRIFNVLKSEHIKALASCVHNKTSLTNAFFLNGANKELSDQQIAQLPRQDQHHLIQSIHQSAAQGIGFLYGRKKIEPHNDVNLSHELKAVFELMNSTALKTLIEQVTGESAIVRADSQVTRFRAGDFLTRHLDIVPGETRRFAYVLGLSDNWHPDWGGLLQFFERDGTPKHALAPQFNSLSVFDVSEVHSVTAIAPFAPRNRYSITGWLRT